MIELLSQTSWWVPAYGLVGAVITLPWSIGLVRRTGSRPAAYLNILMTVLALIHSSLLLWAVWDAPPERLLIPWLHAPGLDIWLTLLTSRISVGGTVIITALSLLAQVFALGYMEKDWALARFFGLMGIFEAAMSGIVLSDSLFMSYALLEVLTLSTYLLVGFWYAQPLVVTAARDAFLTKRVGDLLLLMGVVTLSSIAGSLDFTHLALWAQTAQLSPLVANLLGLALLAGPVGKCAQFPLNLWLDEAMEGPNPASILRNSVVVGCGAYVLIALQPVLALSPLALTTLTVLGALTAIGASLVAIAQIDIKRALSHSTSAYLGLVFLAVGMQQDEVALLLLFVHGLAKALLFMSTGSIILTTSTQDLTEMGGLASRMPATTTAYIVGALASIGLLPLGNFMAMVEWAEAAWVVAPWLMGVLVAVNGLTAFNLVRVFGLVFWGKPQAKTRRAPEVGWLMAVPMITLMIFNLLAPFILEKFQMLPNWNDPNRGLVLVLICSSLVGCGLGAWLYLSPEKPKLVGAIATPLREVLADDFKMNRLYQFSVVFAVLLGSRLAAWFDRYIVDGLVNFVGVASIFSGETLKYTISGQSRHYLLTLFIGILLSITVLSWTLWEWSPTLHSLALRAQP
ncbi:MAG: NAD(P)H-quinone oxidoreductase subunit F [Oscillatoriophycideae cyanobacterium NC_groundwater_1537_Pr4_S-0.65um_50_18]|nr:NAD(P)H-quinone oxidoreductase subunit F [Oscillatoriophycideae cyanobacterium NC_groundwater_1537_Pr4_S-0.65um_50_18]